MRTAGGAALLPARLSARADDKALVFSLALTEIRPGQLALGEIHIGDFAEGFEADLSYWSPDQYVAHWHVAAEQLLHGQSRAAFITSMLDPEKANFIVWWPAWRTGRRIVVRQQLLFMDHLNGPFREDDVFRHVGERKRLTGDREPVSEWVTNVQELADFSKRLAYRPPTRRPRD